MSVPIEPLAILNLLREISSRAKNIKFQKQQFEQFSAQCVLLANALNDGEADAGAEDAAAELYGILMGLRKKAEQPAKHHWTKSFVDESSLTELLNQLKLKLDTCLNTYHIRMSQEFMRDGREFRRFFEGHHAEIKGGLQDLQDRMQSLESASFTRHSLTPGALTVDAVRNNPATLYVTSRPNSYWTEGSVLDGDDNPWSSAQSSYSGEYTRSPEPSSSFDPDSSSLPPDDTLSLDSGAPATTTDNHSSDTSETIMLETPSPVSPLLHLLSDAADPVVMTIKMQELFFLLMLESDTKWNTYFIGHPIFISPRAALNMLMKKFDNDDRWSETSHEQKYRINRSVVDIIKAWLCNCHVIISGNVLDDMQKFAGRIDVLHTEGIFEMIAQKRLALRRAQSSLSIPSSRTKARNIPGPAILAAALARLEKEQSCLIVAAEYIASACRLSSESIHLQDALDFNEWITRWVQYSILQFTRYGDRAKTKSFFLATAEECKKINNFASLCAILVALDSDYIKRLILTNNGMSERDRRKFQKLRPFVSPKSDYKAYRTAFEESTGKGCIPWHHAHLSQIRTIVWERKDVDPHGLEAAVVKQMSLLEAKAMDAWQHFQGSLGHREDGIQDALEYLRIEFEKFRKADLKGWNLKERSNSVMRSEGGSQAQVVAEGPGFARRK